MTTDITELAQSLKSAATEATLEKWYVDNDFDVCSENYGFVAELHGDNLVHNAQFIAMANPANILALVEALEKAQTGEKQWREVVDAFCADDADWQKLTDSNNELISFLSQSLCKQADRIAELESRTVTGKQFDEFQICHYGATEDYAKGYIDCQNNVFKWLTAAGIKWEAE